MLYLAENAEAVSMIDIREKVTETRRKFYINSCVVDKSFPKDKKQYVKMKLSIESIMREIKTLRIRMKNTMQSNIRV